MSDDEPRAHDGASRPGRRRRGGPQSPLDYYRAGAFRPQPQPAPPAEEGGLAGDAWPAGVPLDAGFAQSARVDGEWRDPAAEAGSAGAGRRPVEWPAGDGFAGGVADGAGQLEFSWPALQHSRGFPGWDAAPGTGPEQALGPSAAASWPGGPEVPRTPGPLPPSRQTRAALPTEPWSARPHSGQDGGTATEFLPDYGWPEDGAASPLPPVRRRGGRPLRRAALPALAVGAAAAFAVALLGAGRSPHTAAGPSAAAASTAGSAAHPGATPAGAGARITGAFPGYRGQQGGVTVTSEASGGDVQVAVGSADNRPALWRRSGTGPWTMVSGAGALPLASVTHGAAGWLAIGNSGSGQPVVLTSADGSTWRQAADPEGVFAVPGLSVNAAAAGHGGYVVVGSQVVNGTRFAAMWWSPDLKIWALAGSTIMSTVSSRSSGMANSSIYAVTTTPTGWVGVGTHNGCHTAWVSADGEHWQSYDIPKPSGTSSPMLREVADTGSLVVAAGDIGMDGRRFPLIVVSQDGGVHWQTTTVGGPGSFSSRGTVTALTADGKGFLAAGLEGPPGGQHAVTWTSPDGVSWSPAAPAGNGTQEITVLASSGAFVTSISSVTAAGGTGSVEVTSPVS